MIYILTGDIRTGKTTALLDWSKGRDDVDGLLCPDNENGKRYFFKIKSKIEFEFEVENGSEASEENQNKDLVEIGNFKFLKSAFKTANDYLKSIKSKPENKFLTIDEIGKLELKTQGLHPSAKQLIPVFVNNENKHLILVVRDYLLEDVLRHYSITEHRTITKEDLESLG